MNKGWQLVIHEPSMRVLLAASARHRTAIFKELEKLLANPYSEGDFIEIDETGRQLNVLVCKKLGHYLLARFLLERTASGSYRGFQITLNIRRKSKLDPRPWMADTCLQVSNL